MEVLCNENVALLLLLFTGIFRAQNPFSFCFLSNIEYVKDGLKYMRLKFYIEGSEKGKQGTVHVEVKEVQWAV